MLFLPSPSPFLFLIIASTVNNLNRKVPQLRVQAKKGMGCAPDFPFLPRSDSSCPSSALAAHGTTTRVLSGIPRSPVWETLPTLISTRYPIGVTCPLIDVRGDSSYIESFTEHVIPDSRRG